MKQKYLLVSCIMLSAIQIPARAPLPKLKKVTIQEFEDYVTKLPPIEKHTKTFCKPCQEEINKLLEKLRMNDNPTPLEQEKDLKWAANLIRLFETWECNQ